MGPDPLTGQPDPTARLSTDCFVYDTDQWLNQGCAVTHASNVTLGRPWNDQGGGLVVLEWDPVNRHIRSWVFAPTEVPSNLAHALATATTQPVTDRVAPNPDVWPLPYSYFPIGAGTQCPTSPFQHMQIVFNIAFCGTAAGDRFAADCPHHAKRYDTCEDWIRSDPPELAEAYWKIRALYIYEREWQHSRE